MTRITFTESFNLETLETLAIVVVVIATGLMKPSMVATYKTFFEANWFKIASLSIVAYYGNSNPTLAIALGMLFLYTQVCHHKKIEKFEGPANGIFPGCAGVTVADLIQSFNNDKKALLNAMLFSRVPQNTKLTDYYAPLIATYLLNHGYQFNVPTCNPPNYTHPK